MFAIQSHFDIRRSYNPQTGEEYNVIVENGSDRPWYQREYMRVDWSKNQITDGYDFDSLSQIGIFGGIKWDPETYQITDPNDANAPAFDLATGYFDITTKAERVIPEVSSVATTQISLGNGQTATAFNTQHVETTILAEIDHSFDQPQSLVGRALDIALPGAARCRRNPGILQMRQSAVPQRT